MTLDLLAAVVAHDGKIYVMAGCAFHGNALYDEMFVFDVNLKRWTEGLEGPPHSRNSGTAVLTTFNGTPKDGLYFGHRGAVGSEPATDIDVYDIASGRWESGGQTPADAPYDDLASVVYRDQIHFVGGTKVYTTVNWAYRLLGNGATLVHNPANGLWDTTHLPGIGAQEGAVGVYRDNVFFVSHPALFPMVSVAQALTVSVYDPLRVSAFINDDASIVQWSEFDAMTTTELSMDGSVTYSGTGTDWRDNELMVPNRVHTLRAKQVHPLYGTIYSKPLCVRSHILGDVNTDGRVTSSNPAIVALAV